MCSGVNAGKRICSAVTWRNIIEGLKAFTEKRKPEWKASKLWLKSQHKCISFQDTNFNWKQVEYRIWSYFLDWCHIKNSGRDPEHNQERHHTVIRKICICEHIQISVPVWSSWVCLQNSSRFLSRRFPWYRALMKGYYMRLPGPTPWKALCIAASFHSNGQ